MDRQINYNGFRHQVATATTDVFDSNADLICFSHLRWDFVRQRPQHIMERFARSRRVYFFEEPILTDHHLPYLETHKFEDSGVVALRPRIPSSWDRTEDTMVLAGLLDDFLDMRNRPRPICWFYTPMMYDFARQVEASAIVYDCMDELSAFRFAPARIKELEVELMQRADLVFTGGTRLYEAKLAHHDNVHCFPSSVDTSHFRTARGDMATPADQAAIPHPRLGFYGVIDERVDFDLISEVATRRPDWSIVLVGPVVKVDPDSLPRLPNIHYLGKKDYAELPAYLHGWDVALMPFAINEATAFISPTKTPEYLAAGRPVVSTPIVDVVRHYSALEGIRIAGTSAEFESACDEALQLATRPTTWLPQADEMLAATSWDKTQGQMEALILEALQRGNKTARSLSASASAQPVKESRVNGAMAGRVINATGAGAVSVAANGHASNGLSSPGLVANPTASSALARNGAQSNGLIRSDASSIGSVATMRGMPAFSGSAHPPKRSGRKSEYDVLVVGAGFAGSVLSERLARNSNKRVLVIDRRDHIAGNAYDHYDAAGILVHKYGPHIFHTNSKDVFSYLSRFTKWRPYEHRVLANIVVKGEPKQLPVPINRTTLEMFYGIELADDKAAAAFLASRAEPVDEIRNSEDVVVSAVGRELYEAFFQGYTRKQWGLDPSELDKSVTSRVPTRTNRDDRYFLDEFQAMPAEGYTRMFANMLDHENITVELGVDYNELKSEMSAERTIYTGAIDEYFDHCYGPLPYRCLSFKHETHEQRRFQSAAVVNYPGPEVPYTRITEYKHLTGQVSPRTSVSYEYSSATGDPYYPVPRPENQLLYKRYEALARELTDVSFVGRLATYKYYNMDQVVGQALATYRRLAAAERQVGGLSVQENALTG